MAQLDMQWSSPATHHTTTGLLEEFREAWSPDLKHGHCVACVVGGSEGQRDS